MSDPNGLIRPGRAAPGFSLPATPDGRQTGPGDFRGRPVVLAFHPADRTPVRGDQMSLNQAAMPEVDPGAGGILDALERLDADRRVVAG
ncbi:redoxin domain-containing protein [Micromonospora phytophila]|uniref:redoxin domain-containing protein n=1 Tax=Micromonospora phytophila TaxID=709888 RepID=UPI00202EFF61|nr:redoxin domain-containing protein [Micromonospora phytophila]MCM0678524.1 redoxin domain-containing protein [Micromonospora phytophila]